MTVTFKGLKLRPCPFDGRKCAFHKGEHDEDDIKVVCSGCGAEGPLFNDSYGIDGQDDRANAEEAAKHWNKRKGDPK